MRKNTTFAVFGAGNLGLAQAGHLAVQGFGVSLCNRSAKRLQPIIQNDNRIELSGSLSGSGRLQLVTTNYAEAIAGRDLIIITSAAPGHRVITRDILPVLRPNQALLLHPAYMFGAIEVRQLLADSGVQDILIGELSNTVFACRANGAQVHIFAIKKNIGIAYLPTGVDNRAIETFKIIYRDYIECYDTVLETGLLDLNYMLHPFINMMNAGLIDRMEPFDYYHCGVTPHISNVIEAADRERTAICHALGIRGYSAIDLMKRHYPHQVEKSTSFYEATASNVAYKGIASPDHLYTRNIWEDIPYGIMPIISLGKALEIETPVMQAIYELCRAAFGNDWREEARTLDNLGLIGLDAAGLLRYAQTGL
uniref:2-dehydropantoate 2-reductase n=1 Tax=Candidatus Kentrum sp. LPFa TaxID=2126335 RepID=A0A450X8K8_9GAMM|nr:MAG: opine dehydrogenase [Candidatus Kentron sp. LPFa]VFK25588.1 MAG: opine dehydrogenase [Candidatus Kentron sp. LPFa]